MNDKEAYDKLKGQLLATSKEAWQRYSMAKLMADDLGVEEYELSGLLLQTAVREGIPIAWKRDLLCSLGELDDIQLARLVRQNPLLFDVFGQIGFTWP